MILPDKYTPLGETILGISVRIAQKISIERFTVSSLWYCIRGEIGTITFEKYALTLTFMYTIGAITLVDGVIEVGENYDS